MICINCFNQKTSVINSRGSGKKPSVWRRRHCLNCGFYFTTYENIALDEVLLIQKSDQKLPYNRGKLLASLIDSLRSSGNDVSHAYWLVQTIEQKLLDRHRNAGAWEPITSDSLRTIAYETILAYNTIAGFSYGASHGLVGNNQKKRRGRPRLM